MDNANSPEYLNKIKASVIENLSRTKFGPSVQMTNIPPDIEGLDDEADAVLDDLDEDDNKDARHTQRRWDKYVEKDGELSESDDDDENAKNGVLKQPGALRRRNIMDYQNPQAVPDIISGVDSPLTTSVNGDALAAANGEIHEDLLRAKASASPVPRVGEEQSRSNSEGASDVSNASEVADVEMQDDVLTTAPSMEAQETTRAMQMTPPESPQMPLANAVQAAAPVDVEMAEAQDGTTATAEPSVAKAQGLAERIEEDTNAEAATRFAGGS